MLIIFSFLKSFFSSKVGQYFLIGLVISAICYFGYKHIYNKGVNDERAIWVEVQRVAKAEADKKALEQQTKINELKDDLKTKKIKVETVYIDRVKVLETIKEAEPALTNPVCVIKKENVKKINELLKNVE